MQLSSWKLKCYCSQTNSVGTDRENIVPGKLCIMKSNVKYWQKVTFSIKKYLPIQSTISRSSETSKHQSWNALIKIKINPIQNHWININAIGHPLRRRLFLVPLAWSCFYGVPASSSLLWLAPRRSIFYKQCRYGMFWLGNLLTQFSVHFVTKDCKHHYKVGQLKAGHTLQI